jgi:hypothetical protein
MQGTPKDHDWRVFTQLMYDEIDTLADTPDWIMHRLEVDLEIIELLALARPW